MRTWKKKYDIFHINTNQGRIWEQDLGVQTLHEMSGTI